MHGHGEKPFLCTYTDCDRSIPGNGFPRHWNLRDHLRRVHNDLGPAKSTASGGSPPPQVSFTAPKRYRKRRVEPPMPLGVQMPATPKSDILDENEGHEKDSNLYSRDEIEQSPSRGELKTEVPAPVTDFWYKSTPNLEHTYFAQSDAQQLQAPFTDSGYKSAPNLEHYPCLQLDSRQLPPMSNSLAICDEYADEAKTLYSLESTVNPCATRKYIADLSTDMFGKLRHHFVDPTDRTVLSTVFPELIKAFAVKICNDHPSQENRNITSFIHKRHR